MSAHHRNRPRPPGFEAATPVAQPGPGRLEIDETGDATWVPTGGASGADVIRRLLDDPTLELAGEYAPGTQKRIQQNPAGTKKGYDPYDSGLLMKKEWKKKKDLRGLSAWIQSRKPKDE